MTFQAVGAAPLRVGISGYGLAGRVFHAPLLKGAGFDVAAVVTRNPERMAQVAQDFPEAQICSSIEQMVQMELDLVVVASANLAHVSDALSAIAAGIPVVIDKPLGITEAEVQRIVDASDTCEVGVIPFFNRRWDSDALTIKKVISEGVIGEVFRLDSRFERYRPGKTPRNWRESNGADQGGGGAKSIDSYVRDRFHGWWRQLAQCLAQRHRRQHHSQSRHNDLRQLRHRQSDGQRHGGEYDFRARLCLDPERLWRRIGHRALQCNHHQHCGRR